MKVYDHGVPTVLHSKPSIILSRKRFGSLGKEAKLCLAKYIAQFINEIK